MIQIKICVDGRSVSAFILLVATSTLTHFQPSTVEQLCRLGGADHPGTTQSGSYPAPASEQ